MTSMSRTVPDAVSGDQLAWRDLVGQYDGMLRSIARTFRLNAADGEDAAQECWAVLLGQLHRIRDPERIGGWLATTMRRQCSAITRRRRRESLVPDHESVPDPRSADPADARLLTRDVVESVRRALDRLPPRQRAVLLALSPDPAPTYSEISRSLAMAVGTIGPTRAKALRRMHVLLAEWHLDEGGLANRAAS